MGPSLGYYAYPWNLHEPASDLAAMQSAGMTHVTVAASYHAGKFLQPRDPLARVYFPEDGTVYFRGRGQGYGRLKPQVSALTQDRDVLGQLCDADVMPVRAWTVLNHNSRLGFSDPEVVARNAWGDPYFYSLCPANGHVRDYDIALCADLADSTNVASMSLETPGWLTYGHGYHHEFAQASISPWLDRLMGLCFCEACMTASQAAGVDAARIRRAVRREGDAVLAGQAPSPGIEADLAPYDAWRATVVASLCADIRSAVRPEVGVRIISTCQRPHATCYLEGGDLAAMDRATDGLELPIYQPSVEDARTDLDHVITATGEVSRLSVILRPGLPDMTTQDQVAETIATVLASGVQDLSFYNFGLLPTREFAWLEATVRALREGNLNG